MVKRFILAGIRAMLTECFLKANMAERLLFKDPQVKQSITCDTDHAGF